MIGIDQGVEFPRIQPLTKRPDPTFKKKPGSDPSLEKKPGSDWIGILHPPRYFGVLEAN